MIHNVTLDLDSTCFAFVWLKRICIVSGSVFCAPSPRIQTYRCGQLMYRTLSGTISYPLGETDSSSCSLERFLKFDTVQGGVGILQFWSTMNDNYFEAQCLCLAKAKQNKTLRFKTPELWML